jgi:hypothetical protein
LQRGYAAQLEAQRDKALAHQSHLYNVASGIRGADTNKALSTMAPNMALAEFGATNNNALNYYNADVNRITRQYGMELDAHRSQGPGFGQNLLHLGGAAGMAMMIAPSSSVMGGWGARLFGRGQQ